MNRLSQIGVGAQPYDGFTPKTPSAGKGEGQFTRLTSMGVGGQRVAFTPKTGGGGKGEGQFTRLITVGIGGQRVSFVPKDSGGGGKGVGQFTRLVTFGIGGQRVSFEPKSAEEDTSGGAKKVRTDSKGKRLSQEEVDGLEAYGRARAGIVEEIPEIVEIPIPKSQEIEYILDSSILPESEIFPDSQVRQVELTEELETEQDIGLILAIIQAHNN